MVGGVLGPLGSRLAAQAWTSSQRLPQTTSLTTPLEADRPAARRTATVLGCEEAALGTKLTASATTAAVLESLRALTFVQSLRCQLSRTAQTGPEQGLVIAQILMVTR